MHITMASSYVILAILLDVLFVTVQASWLDERVITKRDKRADKSFQFSEECYKEYGKEGKYACADGNGCFGDRVVCDGFSNCPDRSDEYGCLGIEPSELEELKEGPIYSEKCFEEHGVKGMYSCANGVGCFGVDVICDGWKNCPDGSDEYACLGIEPSELEEPKGEGPRLSEKCFQEYGYKGQYSCADGTGCFGADIICDDFKNCPDGSDEYACLGIEPSDLEEPKGDGYRLSEKCFKEYGVKSPYSCANGDGCFGNDIICDDFKNCPDGSDEYNC